MNLFSGLDLDSVKHEKEGRPEREIVPGRTIHIDADFMAYMVAYDDEKPVSEMYHNAREIVESLRKAAGAEHVTLHLTPSGSNKGDRCEVALTKEYQGNRKEKPKPKFLGHIRQWMHEELGAIMHMTIEADDGMAIAQYKAIADGHRNLSVIVTKDKDLNMVPGLLMDWDTAEITDTEDDFGYIKLDRSKSAAKVVGRGTAFFWAQMLMGDTADNIGGLPLCYDKRFLTAAGKAKSCGPVLTFDLLVKCKNDKQAFDVVKGLYKLYQEKEGFKNWRDGKPVTGTEALVSMGQLLWMRRKPEITDFVEWLGAIK